MRQHLRLLADLERREHEAYLKLLACQEVANTSNFPFALVEWMQLYNAVEMLRRKLKSGSAAD